MQAVQSLTLDFRSTTCVAISGGVICSASIDRTVAVISIDHTVRSEPTPNRIVVYVKRVYLHSVDAAMQKRS